MQLIELLRTLRYPGRFIVVGKSGGTTIGIYGATGRSRSSLARIYKKNSDGIVAVSTDDTALKEGNPELLEYRALKWLDGGFVIANGRQIESVRSLGFGQGELMLAEPEPDKYLTPRITAVVTHEKSEFYIARPAGRGMWPYDHKSGIGHFISTYTGEDVRPTPSFAGDPIEVELQSSSVHDAASAVYEALAPEYRVGVFAVQMTESGERDVAVINAAEVGMASRLK